jgi:hypothetical protein
MLIPSFDLSSSPDSSSDDVVLCAENLPRPPEARLSYVCRTIIPRFDLESPPSSMTSDEVSNVEDLSYFDAKQECHNEEETRVQFKDFIDEGLLSHSSSLDVESEKFREPCPHIFKFQMGKSLQDASTNRLCDMRGCSQSAKRLCHPAERQFYQSVEGRRRGQYIKQGSSSELNRSSNECAESERDCKFHEYQPQMNVVGQKICMRETQALEERENRGRTKGRLSSELETKGDIIFFRIESLMRV